MNGYKVWAIHVSHCMWCSQFTVASI